MGNIIDIYFPGTTYHAFKKGTLLECSLDNPLQKLHNCVDQNSNIAITTGFILTYGTMGKRTRDISLT